MNEKQITTFEDAKDASLQMLEENANQPETAIAEEPAPEPVQEQPEEQQVDVVEDTTHTDAEQEAVALAETAAEAASQQKAQNETLIAENEQLRAENEQQKQALQQMSDTQAQAVVENMTAEPEFDTTDMLFASEEDIQRRADEFKDATRRYAKERVKSDVIAELKQYIDQMNAQKEQNEKDELFAVLAEMPEFKGIDGMRGQIDNILETNKALSGSDASIDEKVISAYFLARGSKPQPVQPSGRFPAAHSVGFAAERNAQ